MKNLILILLILPCFALKCKKDEPEIVTLSELEKLPAATTTGKNTFGVLVDGKAWIPDADGTWNDPLSVELYEDDLVISANLYGTRPNGNNHSLLSTIVLNSISVTDTGTYNLENTELTYLNYVTGCTYSDNTLSLKLVLTKFDKQNRIVAGTFEAVVYNSSSCDTIKFSHGRFDHKL